MIELQTSRTVNELVARLKAREAELTRSRVEAVNRLAAAIELRDGSTGRHVERMGRYCSLLARAFGWDEDECDLIELASRLHDVGKIAIPDRILTKRGPLTAGERSLMEGHTRAGHDLLAGAGEPFLDLAAVIALTHHERFDGTGYPGGIVGYEIPLEGRIAAIADVFDALTSDRPYRRRLRVDQALAIMRSEENGFDPDLLECFFGSLDDVHEILETP